MQNFTDIREKLDPNKILYCLDDKGVLRHEEFRDIPDFEGRYQVSNFGRIKSFRMKKAMILSQNITNKYLAINLYKKGKKKIGHIHQLVAIVFLGHKPDGHKIHVDHINEVKTDNYVWNLQILTVREHSHKTNKNKKSSSKYTGVTIKSETGVITSAIHYKGKPMSLGVFTTEEEASEYYQNAVKAIENGTKIKVKRAVFSSEYKGVCWAKYANKWRAFITVNGIFTHLAYFNDEYDAHLAVQKAEKN